MAQATAPILDSTISDITHRVDDVGLPGQSGHRAGNAGVAAREYARVRGAVPTP
jgi:hypothetical protein